MTKIYGGQAKKPSMLGSFRVLDLTDEKGFLCGKILADDLHSINLRYGVFGVSYFLFTLPPILSLLTSFITG